MRPYRGVVPTRRTPLAHAVARLFASTGLGFALTQAAHGQAPRAPADQPDGKLEEIVVTEQKRPHERIDRSQISKLTESLRDTPQSIATLSRETLDERGVESLNDALRNVPGITLGAGEFSWQGNNPSIRGFNARDDMYLDGMRDFGSYPRDPFNLEAVEVLLGPSSVLFGRGSTGGAINQVSKRPTREPGTELSLNVGSDETVRGTLDLDRPVALLGDGAAFRLNALAHRGEVADRDGAKTERFGLAPSLALELGDASELTLSYFKQTSDDRPDYGLPWLNGKPAPVRRANFYGFDSDYLKTDAGVFTAALAHEIDNGMHLDAQIRYADYTRESRITEPLVTQAVTPATPLDQISVYRYVFLGESDETLLTGQAAFTLELETGPMTHTIVTGLEIARETSAPQFAFGIGVPGTSLLTPTPAEPFSATSTAPRVRADTKSGTLAAYALDTLKLSEHWQVTLGARWDRFTTDYDAERFAGPPTPFNAGDVAGSEAFDQVDRVFSTRAAVVYKPADRQTLYVATSTSFNPSAQSLSLLTSGRGLGTGNALLDPEKNHSVEVGYKAELLDGSAAWTGALFEITKDNARVPDPSNPGFNTLGGEERVRGLSLELSGMLAEQLYLSAGYTLSRQRSSPGHGWRCDRRETR